MPQAAPPAHIELIVDTAKRLNFFAAPFFGLDPERRLQRGISIAMRATSLQMASGVLSGISIGFDVKESEPVDPANGRVWRQIAGEG